MKIGLIGLGRWGENHMRVFSQIDCNFIGIADVDKEKRRIADDYGVDFFPDYKKLLPFVDAVSVVTPTDTHYRIVKDCLLKGKHVFVEKPMTLNSKEAKELVKIAEKNGLILAVGHLFRYNPTVLKLKEIVEKEKLYIHYISARYIHSTKPPRMDCGVIFNFASHLIDVFIFLFGMPKRVFCKKIHYLSEKREDYAIIILDYGNFLSTLEVSWLHPLKKRDMWLITSDKKMYIDMLEQIIKVYPIKIRYEGNIISEPFDIKLKRKEPLKMELKAFCDSVESGRKPVNSGEEGYKVVKICECCLKSSKEGREIRI